MGKKYTTDEIEVGGHMLDASMMGSLNTVVTNSSNYMTTLPSHSHDYLHYSSSELTNTDLDTISTSGVYQSGGSFSSNSNIPYSNYFTMLHLNNASGRAAQLWFGDSPGRMYYRPKQGANTWHPWEHIVTSGSVSQTKSGLLQSNTSLRAPVFYDSNNTGYYLNPASTSNLNALTMADNLTVNGKVYLDSSGSGYYGGAIEIRETAKGGLLTGAWDDSPGISFHWGGRVVKRFGIRADGQFAVDDSPIALQSWVDGTFLRTTEKAADSNLLDGIDSGSFLRSDATDIFTNTIYNRGYLVSGENGHRNKGIFGVYDSTKTSPIWSMGTGYKNHVDGTNFGNLYGLAYKHTNNITGGTMGGGHQMVWCTNGNTRGSIGYNAIWHAESMKAPIFYDSNNTGYYVNPSSTSSMYRLELNNHIDMRAQTSTWIEADVMTDAIGWNTNYGVYIGSNVGGTHYLRGNGTFTTGGSTYNLYHTGNFTPSNYLLTTGKAADSNLLDGIDSTSFLRSDVYDSANDGLQVFRNIGTVSPSWETTKHTLSLENSDSGYISINFHRAGHSSNNIYHTGTEFITDDSFRSTVDLRAPIFYDSDNTGYYVNPSSTTSINVAGQIRGASVRVTNIVTNKIVKFDGSVLSNSIMSDNGSTVSVSGNVEHQGLTMTEGTDVDQVKTFALSLTPTTTDWMDTGINYNDLGNGTYSVQCHINNSTHGSYDVRYSGMMSWFGSGSTNDSSADEIHMHRAGHAPNQEFSFRTLHQASSVGTHLKFQIKSSAVESTAATYTFKFRRLI